MDQGVPILAPDAAGSCVSFDPAAFKSLAELEAGHFWFEARNRLIVWALARYFPYAKRFFELGCGTGYVLSCIAKAFPTMKVSAGELHLEGLVVARSRIPSKSELFQLDATRLPFKEEYDVIGAFDVLEHIEEDELVLTQIRAALKPGGGLLLTVPQHRFLWSATDEHALHVRRYSETELRQKVIGAGFSILRSTSFVSLLIPAMLVSRWKWREAHDNDPFSEFRIGRFLNSILASVMAVEGTAIRCGANFPFGGSRLLIARRAK